MNSSCLNCHKDSGTFIQLICEHQLCIQCAQKLKIPQGLPPLDAKFRICCPGCRRNTTTLNIQNLINREDEKLLFVNMQSSQLSQQQFEQGYEVDGKLSQSKLRKMSYTQRRNNIYAERKTPQVGDRGSKASHQSIRGKSGQGRRGGQMNGIGEIKCSIHKQALMFYCEQETSVMCMQCMYKHMKQQKNHNVCSISDALPVISKLNGQAKIEARRRLEQIQRNLGVCKGNKTRIQQAYQVHQQLIGQQFRQLQKLIRKKQTQNRQYLQRIFKKKQQEITQQISQLNNAKICLKQHYDYSVDSPAAHIYFFNAYNLLRVGISKLIPSNFKQIKKQQFFCFDKLASLDDFSTLLQKFYRPRSDGRQSKTIRKQQSNNPSRASQKQSQIKMKQQFYEQAKKKLQKLNKLQKDQQGKKKNDREEYLNNFFIQEVSKKDLQNSNYQKIPGSAVPTYRKSSASEYVDRKIVHKTLTPTRISNPIPVTKPKKK